MSDIVALVLGISHYPDLPGEWNVSQDCTSHDAIAVTRALVNRGVKPTRIKLLLGARTNLPITVGGVAPGKLKEDVLKHFICRELGEGEFVGDRFFFFCSGHGVTAEKQQETLIVLPDSFVVRNNGKMFNCLAIEQLRAQLQGMPQFAEQIFCINACRTPQEWSVTGKDEVSRVQTLQLDRPRVPVVQARFFSSEELAPTPVEGLEGGYSNGFSKAVVECIEEADWPPQPRDWRWRLKRAWEPTDVLGVRGGDPDLFKLLEKARYQLDRGRQHKLAEGALKRAQKWADRRNEPDLWRGTVLDLHAFEADCLDILLWRLEETVFTEKIAIGGVRRVSRWPKRGDPAERRKRDLREELAYCLTEDRIVIDPVAIVEELAALGPGARVVYVEIDGPCDGVADRPLVDDMVAFWRGIIDVAAKRVPALPYLPLLLIGHVDPDLRASEAIDTTLFYHNDTLADEHERRLCKVRGVDVRSWLDPVIRRDHPRRVDIESELARALRVQLIEDIDVRMREIITAVNKRTA